jgi:hypothetical protein
MPPDFMTNSTIAIASSTPTTATKPGELLAVETRALRCQRSGAWHASSSNAQAYHMGAWVRSNAKLPWLFNLLIELAAAEINIINVVHANQLE